MTDRCVLISSISILSSLLLLLGSSSGGGGPGLETGCRKWHYKERTGEVCCDSCYPGNRMVRKCGQSAAALCTPCESGTFTAAEASMQCTRCRQCAGALVFVKDCTRTADTVCGCRAGNRCGDTSCTYCVKGSANATTGPPTTMKTTTPRHTEVEEDMLGWWLIILISCFVLFVTLMLLIKIIKKLKEEKTKPKGPAGKTKKSPIIATPTDEPQTLVAVECSFHEPAQVIAAESVATEDSENSDGSTEKLIV